LRRRRSIETSCCCNTNPMLKRTGNCYRRGVCFHFGNFTEARRSRIRDSRGSLGGLPRDRLLDG